MIYKGKFKIVGTLVTACDYDYLLKKIDKAISKNNSLIISPVTSQTIVDCYLNRNTQKKISKLDYLPPDSQWVRHTLFFLYGIRLPDRVYGPELMPKVCETAQQKKYRIYLYGTTGTTLKKMKIQLKSRYPKIKICGSFAHRYGKLIDTEVVATAKKIYKTRAHIIFLGLSSPYREIFSLKLKKSSLV